MLAVKEQHLSNIFTYHNIQPVATSAVILHSYILLLMFGNLSTKASLLYRHVHTAYSHPWLKVFVPLSTELHLYIHCLYKMFHILEWANFITPFASLFQVMTSAQRDSFVEKTLSVKTGILKQSVNVRAAMPPSMGILLIVKVRLYFILLRLCSSGCKKKRVWIAVGGSV